MLAYSQVGVATTFSVSKSGVEDKRVALNIPTPILQQLAGQGESYGAHVPSVAMHVGSGLHLLSRHNNGLSPVVHQPFLPSFALKC